MRLLVILLGLGICLSTGCIRREVVEAPPAPRESLNLKARLDAALAIVSLSTRDEALAALGKDAARTGDAPIARQALSRMTSLTARDQAVSDCALTFASSGNYPVAHELARTIVSLPRRDAVMKKLAAGAP